ncbi:MAG: hypothetical protein IJG60_05640, partial [Thermoguttaceae bacterium]|nr:hypothetical protein [Thermoguttaceae bacterium]
MRKLCLESLEQRTLLAVTGFVDSAAFANPASTAADVLDARIVISDAVPTVSQASSVASLSEVNLGDEFYVSVYVKSTDSNYGIQGGYSTLYYDAGGFTPGSYIESPLFTESTYNDGYNYSSSGYISTFGGFPTSMTASYGQTQWALVGTFSFTAGAVGEYTFSTGTPRNAKGNEKETWGYVREDFSANEEYGNPVVSVSLSVVGDTPSADPVEACISITSAVPTATQVASVDSLTEVAEGDTVYVSVYVKSTDSNYGIQGGYSTLYYDAAGFTAGEYTASAIFSESTYNDGYNYSSSGYISTFGGFPTSMTASYGQTQWALVGTFSFTADAAGEYTFSTGTPRNAKGNEKETWGYVREDFSANEEYGNPVATASLSVVSDTPSADPVEACISVTSAIPTATQVDSVETLTEVAEGDTVYVSVYVKSTDSSYGIQGGYSTLYYDAAGFTPGSYIESAIFNESTYNDGYSYPGDGYISTFGGFPTSMTAAYGQTQWALVGTFSFTADAAGEYTFSTGTPRNAKGNEKETWGYVREDFADTEEYGNPVTSLSITVTGAAPTPDIEDVTLTGWAGDYDGAAHSITVSDPYASTDTILYSTDGVNYTLTKNPAYTDAGTYTTYVKVSRAGYNDWTGSATVVINKVTPSADPVEACISVTSAVPTATQVDSVETLTEIAKGDTVYVSVYVKSTDSNYGIQGGYSTLYYDAAGFTAGEYIESAIFNESTYNDGYSYPGDGYISTFGGFPTSMTASYGQTQWALVGTFSFTADAEGEYTFSTGTPRNAKGNEKVTWGYVREDFAQTEEYGNPVTSLSITVTGAAPTPDIEDVTLTGWAGDYDGAA